MEYLFIRKEECCGCTACASICPKLAIKMTNDNEGFEYPVIDEKLCIDCGLCIKVCPIKESDSKNSVIEPQVFAVKHKSNDVRMKSSSGGVYTALTDFILKGNKEDAKLDQKCNGSIQGKCYGVTFDKELKVVHKRATTVYDRDKFRGSKYVQSSLGNVFKQIEKDLKNGDRVFFTGTPCQADGLKSYIKTKNINSDNLIITDVICTGTPSPKVWKDNIEFLEKKYNKKIKDFQFRAKDCGWEGYPSKIYFDDGSVKKNTILSRVFTKIFFTHLALRPICYECKYANTQRISDITLGDFWGIEEVIPEFKDDKGISLVLVNSLKGQLVFQEVKEELEVRSCSIDKCKKYQHTFTTSTMIPPERSKFWSEYKLKGFSYIANKYGGNSLYGRVRYFLIKILKALGLFDFIRRRFIYKRG